MSYPTFVLVKLEEINGTSCGTLEQRCAWVPDADPPEYRRTGSGDLIHVVLKQVTLAGGQKTWDLDLINLNSGACYGSHSFRRSTAADDPTGNFCIRSGGSIDCDEGKASVVDDD